MGYEPIWPEAQGKYDTYNTIVNGLNTLKPQINDAANTYIGPDSNFKENTLLGDYYDIYVSKVDEWLTEAISIKARFSIIQTEYNSRITNATTQRDLWKQRIGKTRWVDDSK